MSPTAVVIRALCHGTYSQKDMLRASLLFPPGMSTMESSVFVYGQTRYVPVDFMEGDKIKFYHKMAEDEDDN